MNVRLCRADELSSVAKLLIDCFPGSFSTVLGKGKGGKLLEKYYREYHKAYPELFFVAEDGGTLIGLCMGAPCGKKSPSREFLKRNLFFVALRMLRLLICGNRVAWKKIWSLLKKPKKIQINDPVEDTFFERDHAELMSVCVALEYRERGIADSLINAFVNSATNSGAKICSLTVRTENKVAIALYERNGFTPRAYAGDSVYMTKSLIQEE